MTDSTSSTVKTRLISFLLVLYSTKLFINFLFQEIKTDLWKTVGQFYSYVVRVALMELSYLLYLLHFTAKVSILSGVEKLLSVFLKEWHEFLIYKFKLHSFFFFYTVFHNFIVLLDVVVALGIFRIAPGIQTLIFKMTWSLNIIIASWIFSSNIGWRTLSDLDST